MWCVHTVQLSGDGPTPCYVRVCRLAAGYQELSSVLQSEEGQALDPHSIDTRLLQAGLNSAMEGVCVCVCACIHVLHITTFMTGCVHMRTYCGCVGGGNANASNIPPLYHILSSPPQGMGRLYALMKYQERYCGKLLSWPLEDQVTSVYGK